MHASSAPPTAVIEKTRVDLDTRSRLVQAGIPLGEYLPVTVGIEQLHCGKRDG